MFSFILNNWPTIISVVIIIVFFIYFILESKKIKKYDDLIRENIYKHDILVVLDGTVLSSIADSYKKTLKLKIKDSLYTNLPASEFFNDINISKCCSFNLKMLDAASGILVGLGLFGTFAGLTYGISNFDSQTSVQIQESIQGLLDGMGTAFYTSLAGMLFSMIFTGCDKKWKNNLSRTLQELTEKLDEKYFRVLQYFVPSFDV